MHDPVMKPLVMVGGGRGSLPRNIIEAAEAQGRALAGYLEVGERPEPLLHARTCLGDQDARIGQFCILNTSCSIDHDSVVGDFVSISPGVHTAGGVTVEDDVFVGLGALIIGGVTVGARTTVGAGAVVVRNITPGATVVGNPARPLERG
jgi:acetyltransferase-like isoleucine patch superfamily enzyme